MQMEMVSQIARPVLLIVLVPLMGYVELSLLGTISKSLRKESYPMVVALSLWFGFFSAVMLLWFLENLNMITILEEGRLSFVPGDQWTFFTWSYGVTALLGAVALATRFLRQREVSAS